MVMGGGMLRIKVIENNKLIKMPFEYLSGIAYEFFLAQFFTWKISGYILEILRINRNLYRIMISFIVCLILATLLHYLFTKPISDFVKKRFIERVV